MKKYIDQSLTFCVILLMKSDPKDILISK
jgi:hypothetical protein